MSKQNELFSKMLFKVSGLGMHIFLMELNSINQTITTKQNVNYSLSCEIVFVDDDSMHIYALFTHMSATDLCPSLEWQRQCWHLSLKYRRYTILTIPLIDYNWEIVLNNSSHKSTFNENIFSLRSFIRLS